MAGSGQAVAVRTPPAGQGPLAADPAPLALGHAAPDPELLAVGQGVLEAVLAHDAAPADLLGLPVDAPRSGKNRSGSTPRQLA